MTPQWVAGLALTGLVGASLGLLGAGGSIIMLPVLVYVVGVEPHAAVPLSPAHLARPRFGATAVLRRAAGSGRLSDVAFARQDQPRHEGDAMLTALAVPGAWIALQWWVLPRLGVPT